MDSIAKNRILQEFFMFDAYIVQKKIMALTTNTEWAAMRDQKKDFMELKQKVKRMINSPQSIQCPFLETLHESCASLKAYYALGDSCDNDAMMEEVSY